jgi:hypothetical protein
MFDGSETYGDWVLDTSQGTVFDHGTPVIYHIHLNQTNREVLYYTINNSYCRKCQEHVPKMLRFRAGTFKLGEMK